MIKPAQSTFDVFMEKLRAYIVPSLFAFIIFLIMTLASFLRKDFDNLSNDIKDLKEMVSSINTQIAIESEKTKALKDRVDKLEKESRPPF